MGDNCRVILVPSYRDAHHDHVFPQVGFLLYQSPPICLLETYTSEHIIYMCFSSIL